MKKTVLKVVALMLVAVIACAALVSCGKTLKGTYETALGTPSFTFKGNKVTLEIDLVITATTIEGKYEIEDDKITFTWEGENADKAEDYSGTLAFAEGDGYITIGGVKYNKVEK
ncbi:MAG: hypothetical protein IKB02_06845 [Clostridia bacterium]|nr:hypothetical protein [Clostridia bacterium]